MDINDLRTQPPGQGVVVDRSEPLAAEGRTSGLIVVGVALAIVGAVVAVASSPDHLVSMVVGIGLFIVGAAIALASAPSLPRTLTVDTRRGDRATSQEDAQGASSTFHGPLALIQLGPDPEQVTGRHTGART